MKSLHVAVLLLFVTGMGLTVAADTPINTLTDAEKAKGWKLLFDGNTLTGWHNFKKNDVRPGWQVKDGVLACVDPHNAGDIVTTDKFDWFELQLDFNISPAGNSGIMLALLGLWGDFSLIKNGVEI